MPATAIPAFGLDAAADRGLDQAADVGGEGFELDRGRRVGGDVALAVADDAGLQRGVEGDLVAGADDQLGRAAADVDDQGRLGRGLLRGGAEVGEPRLLLAVEDPGREREALAQLGDEGAAVLGVADGAGRDRVDRLGPELLAEWRRTRRSPRRPSSIASAESRPERSTPRPSRVTVLRRSTGDTRPRRRRRPAAAPSWCRRRSPRPCGSPLPWRRHSRASRSREVPAQTCPPPSTDPPHCYHQQHRRGVEQPGSSSGS